MTTEILIGKSLRVGVITAMMLTVIGGAIYLFQHYGMATVYAAIPKESKDAFIGTPTYLRQLSTMIPRIVQFDGAAIIQLGVTVLIFTPILRVILSLISFLREKDKLYITITAIVLIVILFNMIFGLH